MQQSDNLPGTQPTLPATPRGASNVVSLAAARLRRQRRRNQPGPREPGFDGIDLFGLDFERLDPAARRLYWFSVTNYSRHLYASACDAAIAEHRNAYAPVTVEHLRKAEKRRLGGVTRRHGEFGIVFVLDALQIFGAAACGALATEPAALAGSGPIPLIVALAATAAIFLTREHIESRQAR